MRTATLFLIFSVSFLSITTSCKNQKYSLQQGSPSMIRFGNGGGFTGAVTKYTLMDNGQLFKEESLMDTVIVLNRVKRKATKSLFEQMSAMNENLLGTENPGNQYFFLEWINPDGTVKTTWGASGMEPDSSVKAMYLQLMEQVR